MSKEQFRQAIEEMLDELDAERMERIYSMLCGMSGHVVPDCALRPR